jgi:hypothetical protein
MRKFKLCYYKEKLRQAYYKLVAIQDSAGCGLALLREISADYREQERKVNELYDKCQTLEGSKS